jgi:membrane protease YdiL (CAAX protease family)
MVTTVLLVAVSPFVIASLWGWARVVGRAMQGQTPLPFTPSRTVPWTAVDVFFCVAVFVLLQMVGGVMVRGAFDLDPAIKLDELSVSTRAVVMLAGSLATLVAALLSLLAVLWHSRATLRDVGLDSRYFGQDLRIGLAAFILFAPPVYAVQLLFVLWFRFPSQHPLITLLKENPDPFFLGISAFTALVVAPFAEEYFFRVLLQGWFHKVNKGREVLSSWFYVSPDQLQSPDRGLSNAPEVIASVENHPGENTVEDMGIWPIFASAILFSLLHASHGPDPIALFFLAVGLGYLYRQTHRVLPCIVVHFLLNLCSLAALLVQISASR